MLHGKDISGLKGEATPNMLEYQKPTLPITDRTNKVKAKTHEHKAYTNLSMNRLSRNAWNT
jgi:hypothetical protein